MKNNLTTEIDDKASPRSMSENPEKFTTSKCSTRKTTATPKATTKKRSKDGDDFIPIEEPRSFPPPKKAKRETEYKPVVITSRSKKRKCQNVDDDKKDIGSVDHEYNGERYKEELTLIILKLENVVKQNGGLQEAIKELQNENILLNNRIDVLEKTISRGDEEFMREFKKQKLDDGVSHDWYGKDIKIRPCPDEFLKPWWTCQQ